MKSDCLTKETLTKLYEQEKLTQREIAIKFNVSGALVSKYMQRYKIKHGD